MRWLVAPVCFLILCSTQVLLLGYPAQTTGIPDTEVELDKYKCYIEDTVKPNWEKEMVQNETGLRYGDVILRFTVHSDGSISDFQVIEGDSAALLKNVSIKVLLASAPFKPFSAALIQETGDSFYDHMTFKVIRQTAREKAAAAAAQSGEMD